MGAAVYYNIMCSKKWIMQSKLNGRELGQIIFHGIFGTTKEDLGILEQITSEANWYQRSHFKENIKNLNLILAKRPRSDAFHFFFTPFIMLKRIFICELTVFSYAT